MSNIFSHQCLSVPLKYYPIHSIFAFRNKKKKKLQISIGRRSRRVSSSDIVLISTTEQPDGSLLFRFGDASEVVSTQEESNIVKVLDDDQDRQVFVSHDGTLTDIAIDEKDTKFVTQESMSDEEQLLSSPSEAKSNDSLQLVNNSNEGTHSDVDETVNFESIQVSQVQKPYDEIKLDEVPSEDTAEGLMPPASLPIPDVELSDAANEEALQDIDISEATLIDEMPTSDVIGEPTLDEVEVTMEVSSIEAAIVTDQVVKDEVQEASTNIKKENDFSNVLPISSKEEANLTVEEEEVSQTQSAPLELKPTMQVSCIELQYTAPRYPDDGILLVKEESDDLSVSVKPETVNVSVIEVQDAKVSNFDEGILQVADESENKLENIQISEIELQDTMSLSPDDVVLHVTDESEDPSVSVTFKTIQISDIQLQDTMGPNPDDGTLQIADESEDPSVSVKLKTVQISDTELLDTMSPNPNDGTLQVTDESEDPSVSVKLETVQISDTELVDTMGQNPDDGTLQVAGGSEDPPVSVKLEMVQISDTELLDTMGPNPDDGTLQVAGESQDPPVSVKLETVQISDTELLDTMGPNSDDGTLQVADESEDPSVSIKLETIQISDTEFLDTVGQNPDDGILQVADESEDPSVSKNFETIQVSDTELPDTMDQNRDDWMLQVNDESEDPSVYTELETMQVSNIEVMDVTQLNAEDKLDKVETEDTSEGDAIELLSPATIHNNSDVELTDAANEDMEERLQFMNINEGVLVDGMPSSDSLRFEPTNDEVIQLQSSHVELEESMEISTTNGKNIKNLIVDDQLQQVNNDDSDGIDVADVMTIPEQDSIPLELQPTMEVSDVEIQDATCQNLDGGILQAINEEAGGSFTMDVEQVSYKLEGQPVQDEGENHSTLEQCAESDVPGISMLLKEDAADTLPEAEKTEEDVSSSELAEASEDTALLLATEAKVKREEIYLTGEFLLSGAVFLAHPFKALTGGDDAYFVAGDKWLGVASGVSQWSFEGTDPGVYAQELMKTCEDIVLNTRSVPVTNPVELICRGVKETNLSGSSNVLIANFDGQALHVANIGDTGFLIIRHGAIYKKSSPLLHEFHFALQVEDCDDPLQLVEESRIELEKGDIVVTATDGLFDNLYEREIAMIVSKSLQAEMKPQEIANILAMRAQEVGKSAFVRSPFSDAAQAAGYTGYVGGKPDNVAVIVSLVEKRSNMLEE